MRLKSLILLLLFSLAGFSALADADRCGRETTPAGLAGVMAATFTVHDTDLQETILGSAFVFWHNDIAVNNAHVVNNAAEVLLISADGQRRVAQILAKDEQRDIAVLRLPDHLSPIPPTPYASPCLGQRVFALGAPFGAEFSLSAGVVSRLERQIEANVPVFMLQHDAAVNPGSSGGPLVDDQGRLVGMNSQIADGFRQYIGISYAIPTPVLNRVVAALIAGNLPDLPRLGLNLRPVDGRISAALGLADRMGVLVDYVEPDGLSQRAGVLAGDIILAINGRAIGRPGDIAFALEAIAGQPRFEMTVLRAGQYLRLLVKRAASPVLLASETALPKRKTSYSLAEIGLELDAGGTLDAVQVDSLGQYIGLDAGDRIIALNGQPVTSVDLPTFQVTGPVLLLVQLSDGSTRHFLVDPWNKPARLRPLGGANVLDTDVVIF